MALLFALALPALALVTVASVQIAYVVNVRSAAQDVADSAALVGAQQMSVSPAGATLRARSWATAQLAARASQSTFRVAASFVGEHDMKVAIDSYTPSFFGDLLPKGGFRSHAEATAEQQAQTPLCVLVHGAPGDLLRLGDSAQINGRCLMHSDGDVQAQNTSSVAATRVEATGAATGAITPTAFTGAPRIEDPFTSVPISYPPCTGASPVFIDHNQNVVLPAGMHDGDVTVFVNSIVTLAPGEHYFCGKFTISVNSNVFGDDVVLIFDKQASYVPQTNAILGLSGRRSGPLAGFVWIVAPDNTDSFTMSTNSIQRITGVIYSPKADLKITGDRPAAQASDWTVVATRKLEVSGNADLQINTNYQGSPVPAPPGVGDKTPALGAASLKLVQ